MLRAIGAKSVSVGFMLSGTVLGVIQPPSEVNFSTGYRNDNSRVALCATLSDPRYYGYGQMRMRNINMWEFQLDAKGTFAGSWYGRVLGSYATALSGRYQDSGVFDLLSDPFNAALGAGYYACCECCKPDLKCPCCCPCSDQTERQLVQAKGSLRGQAWDFSGALGYAFSVADAVSVVPVVGWSYDTQRYSTYNGIYGAFPMQYFFVGCAHGFYNDNEIMFSGAPAGNRGVTVFEGANRTSVPLFLQWDNVQGSSDFPLNVGCQSPCVAFGDCSNNTIYRARWNSPFIGFDLFGYYLQWNFAAGYELHYQSFSGRIQTLGGTPCNTAPVPAGCTDLCPGFASLEYRDDSSPQEDCVPFCPATVSFSSRGWGQVFWGSAFYDIASNWQVGVKLRYAMANANRCRSADPCQSCCLVFNGAAQMERQNGFIASANPIWADASLQSARWRSFSALMSLGYLF